MPETPERAVLLLAGALDPELIEIAREERLIVCADSAAEYARSLELVPHTIIGDLDSISNDTIKHFEDLGVTVSRVPDQTSNDFEKALAYIATIHTGEVIVLGLTGLRTDHTLTNLSVMLRWTNAFERLVALDPYASYEFVTEKRGQMEIDTRVGQRISLLPFGVAKKVSTENLHYALSQEDLALGLREGLSNVATATLVQVSIESGALLVIAAR